MRLLLSAFQALAIYDGPPFSDSRVNILGIHVSAISADDVLHRIEEWIESGARTHVCVCDMNSLLAAREDSALRDFYNSSGLTLPDGMPLVWAGRAAGFQDIERVCGPDLFPAVLSQSVSRGWRHYLLGGAEGVADRLAQRCRQDFPGVKIVGTESPPFRDLTEGEKRKLVDRINASQADILWVGLGAPKQERWMAEYRRNIDPAVLIGVGAAFNFQVGDIRRAPKWMQGRGLEWAFRLQQEPKRLWRRYLFGIPRFSLGLLQQPPRRVR